MKISIFNMCDRACKNGPYECKLYQVIFSLIPSVQDVISHSFNVQKKAH